MSLARLVAALGDAGLPAAAGCSGSRAAPLGDAGLPAAAGCLRRCGCVRGVVALASMSANAASSTSEIVGPPPSSTLRPGTIRRCWAFVRGDGRSGLSGGLVVAAVYGREKGVEQVDVDLTQRLGPPERERGRHPVDEEHGDESIVGGGEQHRLSMSLTTPSRWRPPAALNGYSWPPIAATGGGKRRASQNGMPRRSIALNSSRTRSRWPIASGTDHAVRGPHVADGPVRRVVLVAAILDCAVGGLGRPEPLRTAAPRSTPGIHQHLGRRPGLSTPPPLPRPLAAPKLAVTLRGRKMPGPIAF